MVFYKLPYLVYSPGGLTNVENRYELENKKKINGSVNVTYVNEVQPNLPYLLYAYLRHYQIEKIKDVVNEDLETEQYIDKLLYYSSIDNAIYNAYKYANKEINLSNYKYYVYYNENDQSKLKPGDLLLEINGQKIIDSNTISDEISKDLDHVVLVRYERDKKVNEIEVPLIKIDEEYFLGVTLINTFDYDTKPKIKYLYSKNVSGPSGGAMMALSIYCNLIDKDLTKGLKIAGTGTINSNGNIGPVGGIDFKIKSAVKAKVDVFFVPKTINYEKIKKLDINLKNTKVVPVDNFEDIINYLKNRSNN